MEKKMKKYGVYYSKDFAASCHGEQEVDINNLEKTHVLVASCIANSLEDVYRIHQAEIWSPNGEKRWLIEALGIKHTSMSVGDLIFDSKEVKLYKVMPVGFEEIST